MDAPRWGEGSDPDANDSATRAEPEAPSDRFAFAPSTGDVNMFTVSGDVNSRRLLTSLRFSQDAINAFGPRNGYEHELFLYDPDYTDGGRAPACRNERERFWAQRKAKSRPVRGKRPHRMWRTTFPEASKAELDTDILQNCEYNTFGIIVKRPRNLQPNVVYGITFSVLPGLAAASENQYGLTAQKGTFCGVRSKRCHKTKKGYGQAQRLVRARDGVIGGCWRYFNNRTEEPDPPSRC